MYEIGQKVVVGKSTGTVVGYEYVDGEVCIGITLDAITLFSGRTARHTAWYTEDELKEYGIVPIERGESA